MLAAGLTACGTAKELSAQEKAAKAFNKVGDSKNAAVTFSVDATADQIMAFDKATGDGTMERKAAEGMSGLKIAVSVSSDKPLKDAEAFKQAHSSAPAKDYTPDKSLRIAYTLSDRNGTQLLEFREVDAKAYLHLDLKGLAKTFGEDPAEIDKATKDLPADLTAVRNVLAGKWVSFDLQEFADAAKKSDAAKGTAGAPAAKPSADPQAAKDLYNSLKDVFRRTVTIEDKGKKDGTDHLWVSAPARQVVDEVFKAVKPLSDKFPKEFGKFPTSAPSKGVPEGKVGVDVYLKDGAFSSATFDVAQLTEKAGQGVTFPVKLAYDQSAPAVEAPADASKLSVEELQNTVMSLVMAGAKGPNVAGGEDPTGTPAAPLTDAQLKELAAAGVPAEQAQMYNKLGLTFEDIKDLASKPS
ncbi:hypothetical protein ACPC54_21315 [Kitasatospora sp. NPDC094028]